MAVQGAAEAPGEEAGPNPVTMSWTRRVHAEAPGAEARREAAAGPNPVTMSWTRRVHAEAPGAEADRAAGADPNRSKDNSLSTRRRRDTLPDTAIPAFVAARNKPGHSAGGQT